MSHSSGFLSNPGFSVGQERLVKSSSDYTELKIRRRVDQVARRRAVVVEGSISPVSQMTMLRVIKLNRLYLVQHPVHQFRLRHRCAALSAIGYVSLSNQSRLHIQRNLCACD